MQPIVATLNEYNQLEFKLIPEVGNFKLLEIPREVYEPVSRRLAGRIGLKQGDALPMRILAAELGVQAGPDAHLIGCKPASDIKILAWRQP